MFLRQKGKKLEPKQDRQTDKRNRTYATFVGGNIITTTTTTTYTTTSTTRSLTCLMSVTCDESQAQITHKLHVVAAVTPFEKNQKVLCAKTENK